MYNDADKLPQQALDETKALINRGGDDDPPKDLPFHERVKALRAELQLTQAQFADIYGLPAATVRNWEQGRRKNIGAAAEVLIKMIEKDPQGMAEMAVKDEMPEMAIG